MTDRPNLSCSDVDDLAALYVLDALGAAEATEVAAHLADHADRHPAFRELAGVTPFLAESIEPLAPPPDLRARVMGAIAVTPQVGAAPGQAAGATAQAAPTVAAAASAATAPSAQAVPPAQAVPVSVTAAVPVPERRPVPVYQPVPDWSPLPSNAAPAPTSIDAARATRRRRSPVWAVLAAAAVLAIVVLGGWNVLLQQQSSDTQHRLALLTDAVTAQSQPGATVAPMTGSDAAAGATGYVVFPAQGTGYIVLTGLPAAPGDHAWQAWTIGDGSPVSAGMVPVGSDGLAVLEGVTPIPGTKVVALTIEPTGGSQQPTTAPVVVGQLGSPLAIAGVLLALAG